jgi:hypothetical protein
MTIRIDEATGKIVRGRDLPESELPSVPGPDIDPPGPADALNVENPSDCFPNPVLSRMDTVKLMFGVAGAIPSPIAPLARTISNGLSAAKIAGMWDSSPRGLEEPPPPIEVKKR